MNKKHTYLIIVLLILVTLIAFGRIIGNGFINFDDPSYITENNYIKSGINLESVKWAFTRSYAANWHPLTWFSHMLDWQLFGANAAGHHFVSLLLHIGSAILLFLFLSKTTGSLWRSAFVAALFALHPLRVESVAWASERKDVLSMFLGLSSIYAYAYYIESSKLSRYFIALILFALSLMAKPMLVTLPFVLLLLDYWPLGRWQKALQPGLLPVSNDSGLVKKKGKQLRVDSGKEKKISLSLMSRAKIIRSLLWEKGPFIFLSTVSSILTIWAQSKWGAVASLGKLPLIDRIWNAIISYVAYLGKTFWPADFAVLYPLENSFQMWQIFGALLLLLGISVTTIFFIKKAPFLFVGWSWYLGTLIPVIGLMQVGMQSMADRYTYFPSIGIAIILTWGFAYLVPKAKLRKIILLPAVVIILAVLTFLTWQQCGYWKNSISLFTHVVQATKDNYLAHDSLGAALAAVGKKEEAIAHYREAIDINPFYPEAYSNMGVVLAVQGRNEEAIAHYLAAININPNYGDAFYNLANLYVKQRKIEEAIDNYRQAIKINPDHVDAHCNLADVFVKQNKLDQAIFHFREAVRIAPSSFSALNNLGVNLEKQLKHDEAIYYYRKAMLIEPQYPGIYFNLGVALGNKGEIKEAIDNFRQASNLKPDYEEARRALKLALELEKR
jgi:tetratricopeptide (TPR) repeat protein